MNATSVRRFCDDDRSNLYNFKDGPKGKWHGRSLHDLDDEVENVVVRVVGKMALWGDYEDTVVHGPLAYHTSSVAGECMV